MTFRSVKPKSAFDNSWKGVMAVAKAKGVKFPEVVAAQWALESGYGKHTSGKNNFFGIKGSPGTTTETKEFLNGKWVTIKDTFKDYNTPEECIQHLISLWYDDYKGYEGVNRATSAEECCRLLQQEGYATDPSYPQKLINLIKENN
jgi:flagellum-specific peptidoglycan hydrolase FlgJ